MPDSSTQPAFQQLQYAFAAHLRDPENNPAPADIEARRMQIYADLFYKNMAGYLAGAFPVLHTLYTQDDWHALVRAFYARHQSHSPQFYQIAGEFLDYLQNEHSTRDCDPAFLLELAHYEWVEMILAIDPVEPDWDRIDAQGDLLDAAPALTPWLRNLSYCFDVQRIGVSYQPQKAPAQPTYLAVFRRLDDEIRFLEINAMTAHLLQGLIDDPGKTGRQQLVTLAARAGQDPGKLLDFGADLLNDLRKKQLILGARINP